jgi:hypothetical protein
MKASNPSIEFAAANTEILDTIRRMGDSFKTKGVSAAECAKAMQALARGLMFHGEAAVAFNNLSAEQQEQVARATTRVLAAVAPVEPDDEESTLSFLTMSGRLAPVTVNCRCSYVTVIA